MLLRAAFNLRSWLGEGADQFLRYPGWLEVITCIGGGILYTLILLVSGVGIDSRAGLRISTFFMPPWFWEVAGVILASGHGWALAKKDLRGRARWTALSAMFWCNITYGVAAGMLIDGKPLSVLLATGVLVSVICLVLTWRLWRGYE